MPQPVPPPSPEALINDIIPEWQALGGAGHTAEGVRHNLQLFVQDALRCFER